MYEGKVKFTAECIKAIVGTEKKTKPKQSVSVQDSMKMFGDLGVPRHLQGENN